jgi:hypothetical protein
MKRTPNVVENFFRRLVVIGYDAIFEVAQAQHAENSVSGVPTFLNAPILN